MTTTSPRGLAEAVVEPLRYIIGPVPIVLNRDVVRDHTTWRTSYPEAGIPQTLHGGVANDVPPCDELLPNGQRGLTAGKVTGKDGDISLTGTRCRAKVRLSLSSECWRACSVLCEHQHVVEFDRWGPFRHARYATSSASACTGLLFRCRWMGRGRRQDRSPVKRHHRGYSGVYAAAPILDSLASRLAAHEDLVEAGG
jgi:hypothetical protein